MKKPGLMQALVIGAAIGASTGVGAGPFISLPRQRTGPPSEKPPDKRTNWDKENIRLAAERRKHKAIKRAENIRKAEEGKRK